MSNINRGPRRPQILRPSGRPAREAKVALGYPYGPISPHFMHSLLGLREREVLTMVSGGAPLVRYRLPQDGIYVDRNRNVIAERFLKTDAEWLLQIDTDVEFPATLVETLIELAGRDKRVLAASVPPGGALMMTDRPGHWVYVPADLITPEGIECDGLATAVLLVHREVLEAIADREGQRWFFKSEVARLDDPASAAAWAEGGRVRDRRYILTGEDLAFCHRAREAGFKLWCAKVEGLRHHKTLPLSHDFDEPASAEPLEELG